MKKVTNISLAGIAFSIEEDAYEALRAYLAAIEEHFASLPDGKEILADIESGIEEKLSAALETKRSAISLAMVERVVADMGRVEDIVAADGVFEKTDAAESGESKESDEKGEEKKEDQAGEKKGAPKRLFRDTENAILGGVAAGIANYLGVDPVFVRLAFALSIFLNGLGILVYLILWLIVPAAKTTTDKYQMRGESITLSNIAERVQGEVSNLHDKYKEGNVPGVEGVWARIKHALDATFKFLGGLVRGVFNPIFRFVGAVVRFLLSVLRVVVGFALILGGALAIAGAVSMYVIMFFALDPSTTDPITRTLLETLTAGGAAGIIFLISAFLAGLIPTLAAIIAGSSLLTRHNHFTLPTVLTLGINWIVMFSVAVSTFLVLLPGLSETVKIAKAANLAEERTWREIPLEGAPEDVLVRGQVSIHLIEDDEASLRILASDDAFREVHVLQSGRSLEIDRDVHFRMCFFCSVYTPYVVELRAPNVEELAVRGNGKVFLEGVRGDVLDITAFGAFDVVAEDVVVSDFAFTSRGAHEVALLGEAEEAAFDVSGATDVSAAQFAARRIALEASGANTIRLRPLESLTGELRGGNTLRYIESDGLEVDVQRFPESANTVKVMESEADEERPMLIDQVRTAFQEAREE